MSCGFGYKIEFCEKPKRLASQPEYVRRVYVCGWRWGMTQWGSAISSGRVSTAALLGVSPQAWLFPRLHREKQPIVFGQGNVSLFYLASAALKLML